VCFFVLFSFLLLLVGFYTKREAAGACGGHLSLAVCEFCLAPYVHNGIVSNPVSEGCNALSLSWDAGTRLQEPQYPRPDCEPWTLLRKYRLRPLTPQQNQSTK
jgi:hypothetical protein